MSLMNRFEEILRRLAVIDEGFVEGGAGLGLGPAGTSALEPRTDIASALEEPDDH